MSESFVKINNINLCYEMRGNGEPLFLIHGFGSKKEVFIGQFQVLSQKYKVIRLDNRGSGKSDRPDMLYSMDMFVEDIKALMNFLDIKKAHFLGYSLGGMIVQNFIIKYPERVDKLILINTVPKVEYSDVEIKQYIDSKIANYEVKIKDPERAFFEGAEGGYTPEFIEFMKKYPTKKIHNMFTAKDLIKDSSINPTRPQDYLNQAPALRQHDVIDKLSSINHETLIMCASDDMVTPKILSRLMNDKIPKSTLIEIKGMHSTPKEKAPEINRAILNFLSD